MRPILAGEDTVGTKILRRDAEAHRGVGDGSAVIAAGRRDHAGRRHLAQQQVGEGAARLERSRVLEELELERQRERREAEVAAARASSGVSRTCGRMTS